MRRRRRVINKWDLRGVSVTGWILLIVLISLRLKMEEKDGFRKAGSRGGEAGPFQVVSHLPRRRDSMHRSHQHTAAVLIWRRNSTTLVCHGSCKQAQGHLLPM
ncbi:hypothetical protein OPV22_007213 [Ensete ventricosum]|uniref:Uncharacterized protein n=1 Tax=Ensete ventricosum TaxID=4639 RepID=A0AAV8RN21_ENSVE|nr:hypothetical protein OPV22_007213 [Ensete ventricosum]